MEKSIGKYNHCLRPESTELLLKELLQDRLSINLVGPPGTGKGRLIRDILAISTQEAILVALDMQNYKYDLKGFLGALQDKLGTNIKRPRGPAEIFERAKPGYYLLMLDNFDALQDNPQLGPHYTMDFFNDLNVLKNRDNISLLITTCDPHKSVNIYIKGEAYGTSPLTLVIKNLPSLTQPQTETEIQKRLNPGITLSPKEEEQLIKCILKKSQGYTRLEFILRKINSALTTDDRPGKFSKKLKKWNKEFKKQHKPRIKKKLHKLRNSFVGTCISLGLNKLKIPFTSLLEKLFSKKG